MVRAVIFDMDGVLIDSEGANIIAGVNGFKDFGITLADEDISYIQGRHPDDYLVAFAQRYAFDISAMRKRIELHYFEALDQSKAYEQVVVFLREVAVEHLVGLCTSSPMKVVKIHLEKRGLMQLFDVIVSRDECSVGKPKPDAYLMCAEQLGVMPSECLVIEDTSVGVQAGKNAGMSVWALPNEHTKNEDFSVADRVVNFSALSIENI